MIDNVITTTTTTNNNDRNNHDNIRSAAVVPVPALSGLGRHRRIRGADERGPQLLGGCVPAGYDFSYSTKIGVLFCR